MTTKVFLGLTVGCAQCHDHKYDPIPTKDYYSLLGIFRSTQSSEYPLVAGELKFERYKSQKKKIDDLKEILSDYLADQTKQLTDLLSRDTARYLVAVRKGVEEESGLDTETLARWKKYLADSNKEHPYLKPWYDVLAANPSEAQVREAAERYQQFVLQLIEEAKEVDDKNYVAFGGKKGLKDRKNLASTRISSPCPC